MSRASAADPGPAETFAALGEPNRLRLVSKLSDGEPRSIRRLTSSLTLTRQGVSKHLRTLEEAGLVVSERVGREKRYALRLAPLAEAQGYLGRVSKAWDDAVGRLAAHLEAGSSSERKRGGAR